MSFIFSINCTCPLLAKVLNCNLLSLYIDLWKILLKPTPSPLSLLAGRLIHSYSEQLNYKFINWTWNMRWMNSSRFNSTDCGVCRNLINPYVWSSVFHGLPQQYKCLQNTRITIRSVSMVVDSLGDLGWCMVVDSPEYASNGMKDNNTMTFLALKYTPSVA